MRKSLIKSIEIGIDLAATMDYRDSLTSLDQDGLWLGRYYFPIATTKVIPIENIESINTMPLSLTTGKWKGWGSTIRRPWMPLGLARSKNRQQFLLTMAPRIRPGITPAILMHLLRN